MPGYPTYVLSTSKSVLQLFVTPRAPPRPTIHQRRKRGARMHQQPVQILGLGGRHPRVWARQGRTKISYCRLGVESRRRIHL